MKGAQNDFKTRKHIFSFIIYIHYFDEAFFFLTFQHNKLIVTIIALNPSINRSNYISIYLPMYLSIYQCIYLSVYIFLSRCLIT